VIRLLQLFHHKVQGSLMSIKMNSTRGRTGVSIDEAIKNGLAPDGGLYIPESFPRFDISAFYNDASLVVFSARLLAPFFTGSAIEMTKYFCQKIFSFPLPLKPLANKQYVMELFHGPTLSFKDFGARFFAQCLEQLAPSNGTKVLVATSGDTGSAVASALHGIKGIEGIILFPKDKISLRQQAQITCWGDNIHAVAVKGTFDQCQQLVKQAFSKNMSIDSLTTANSINIARLLPQLIFYAYSSIKIEKQHHQPANFIVPSGNLGNVTACYWAKALGFPIDEVLIATNANKVLTEFLLSGNYSPQPSLNTLANAMDVGDPSNLERLIHLFSTFDEFKQQMNAASVSDREIKEAIISCYNHYQYVLCPHTATAYHRLNTVDANKPWVIMATAHPVKFETIIEPLLNIDIPIPDQLHSLLNKPQHFKIIDPVFESLEYILRT
jgi:threonine synthase